MNDHKKISEAIDWLNKNYPDWGVDSIGGGGGDCFGFKFHIEDTIEKHLSSSFEEGVIRFAEKLKAGRISRRREELLGSVKESMLYVDKLLPKSTRNFFYEEDTDEFTFRGMIGEYYYYGKGSTLDCALINLAVTIYDDMNRENTK